jgi:hypothetical protein
MLFSFLESFQSCELVFYTGITKTLLNTSRFSFSILVDSLWELIGKGWVTGHCTGVNQQILLNLLSTCRSHCNSCGIKSGRTVTIKTMPKGGIALFKNQKLGHLMTFVVRRRWRKICPVVQRKKAQQVLMLLQPSNSGNSDITYGYLKFKSKVDYGHGGGGVGPVQLPVFFFF